MIEPIKPEEITPGTTFKGPLYREAVSFINEAISTRNWHAMWIDKENILNNYNAIIESPCGAYRSVMPMVVESFKEAGWDCMYQSAYDARGPHACFYVHKKHFEV